jgi:hypothetical protein
MIFDERPDPKPKGRPRSAKELIYIIQYMAGQIEKELDDSNYTADVQIADTNSMCWIIVDTANELQHRVFDDLSDLEGNDV